MRASGAWLVVPLVTLAAGCATPPEPENHLVGYCPQWLQGPETLADELVLRAAENRTTHAKAFAPGNLTFKGRPFDMVRIQVTGLTGRLELRASPEGNDLVGLKLRDFRHDQGPVPVLHLNKTATGHEFEAYVSDVNASVPDTVGPIRLHWTLVGESASATYTVTLHHKVCGAPVP